MQWQYTWNSTNTDTHTHTHTSTPCYCYQTCDLLLPWSFSCGGGADTSCSTWGKSCLCWGDAVCGKRQANVSLSLKCRVWGQGQGGFLISNFDFRYPFRVRHGDEAAWRDHRLHALPVGSKLQRLDYEYKFALCFYQVPLMLEKRTKREMYIPGGACACSQLLTNTPEIESSPELHGLYYS